MTGALSALRPDVFTNNAGSLSLFSARRNINHGHNKQRRGNRCASLAKTADAARRDRLITRTAARPEPSASGARLSQ